MDCERVRERIHLYLDNQLTAIESNELMGHISKCGECQEELTIWRNLVGAIQNSPVMEPPNDFSKRLQLSLPEHAYETSIYSSIFWVGLFLFVATLLVLCWILPGEIFEAISSFQVWKTILWASVGCAATVISVQIAGVLGIVIQQRTSDDLK